MVLILALLTATAAPNSGLALASYHQGGASRIPRHGETTHGPATLVLQRFARCFVEDYPDRAAALVDPPLGTVDRRALFVQSQDELNRCLGALGGGQMSPNMIVMLGAIAEQLYIRRFTRLPVLAAANLPRPNGPPGEDSVHTTLVFANCVIDRDAAAVDRLVRARVGSREEEGAFATLSTHYPACFDAGSSLTVTRLALRTALADQLYRRALAAGGAAPER